MASLLEKAMAAKDEMFIVRVQAAASMLGLPYDPAMVMHVATRVDLSNGPEGVDDMEILQVLQPENVEPTPPPEIPIDQEPESSPVLEITQ